MISDQRDNSVTLSTAERSKSSILIVESEAADRNNMRVAFKSLGYGGFGDAPNHATALARLSQRKFTHVIFEAKKTNMPPKEFLHKVFEGDSSIIAIPSSYEPNVDDVFDLLIMGAKGYLVKPFTQDSVDQAVVMATKGEPMSEAVLQARDRNEALIAILMASVDKTATILRQAQQFETARREIPRCMAGMRRSAELAKNFAKGGEAALMEAMERFCIERSKGPATKLGRLRKRLKTVRVVEDGEESDQESESA